jgi:hypothetical protein
MHHFTGGTGRRELHIMVSEGHFDAKLTTTSNGHFRRVPIPNANEKLYSTARNALKLVITM